MDKIENKPIVIFFIGIMIGIFISRFFFNKKENFSNEKTKQCSQASINTQIFDYVNNPINLGNRPQ